MGESLECRLNAMEERIEFLMTGKVPEQITDTRNDVTVCFNKKRDCCEWFDRDGNLINSAQLLNESDMKEFCYRYRLPFPK